MRASRTTVESGRTRRSSESVASSAGTPREVKATRSGASSPSDAADSPVGASLRLRGGEVRPRPRGPGGRGGRLRRAARSPAECSLHEGEHVVRCEVSHHDERHVPGDVAILVVREDVRAGDSRERRLGAEDGARDRRAREREGAERRLRVVVGVAAIAGELLEDDLALLVEVLRGDRRVEEHVGLDRERLFREVLGGEHREQRVVLARGRVVVRAEAVHVVVELLLRSRGGPVEQQMLEEMRRARRLRWLVRDARGDDHRGGDHRIGVMGDQDHSQPVVERDLGRGGRGERRAGRGQRQDPHHQRR